MARYAFIGYGERRRGRSAQCTGDKRLREQGDARRAGF